MLLFLRSTAAFLYASSLPPKSSPSHQPHFRTSLRRHLEPFPFPRSLVNTSFIPHTNFPHQRTYILGFRFTPIPIGLAEVCKHCICTSVSQLDYSDEINDGYTICGIYIYPIHELPKESNNSQGHSGATPSLLCPWKEVGLIAMSPLMWIRARERTWMTILSKVATLSKPASSIFGSRGFVYSALIHWIHAEYIRIYNALEAYYQKRPSTSNQAPTAVITGQPGIGES